jgi:hypothetical protein
MAALTQPAPRRGYVNRTVPVHAPAGGVRRAADRVSVIHRRGGSCAGRTVAVAVSSRTCAADALDLRAAWRQPPGVGGSLVLARAAILDQLERGEAAQEL